MRAGEGKKGVGVQLVPVCDAVFGVADGRAQPRARGMYVCKLTRVSLLAAACEHKSEVWLQTEVKQFSSRDGTEWQRQVEEAEEASKNVRGTDKPASTTWDQIP